MQIDERFYTWQVYQKRANSFWSDVDDDLNFRFAPFSASHPDKDTTNVRKLFDLLADINAFISQHTDELEKEFCAWEDKKFSAQAV